MHLVTSLYCMYSITTYSRHIFFTLTLYSSFPSLILSLCCLLIKINELAASVLLVELRDKQLSDAEILVEKLKATVVELEASIERIELDLAERNTKIMLLQVTYEVFLIVCYRFTPPPPPFAWSSHLLFSMISLTTLLGGHKCKRIRDHRVEYGFTSSEGPVGCI